MAADNKKVKGEGARSNAIIWWLFIFLVLGVANVFIGLEEADHNKLRIAKAGNLRVLSQQIAKNAAEAVNGNEQAFTLLIASTKEFQAQFDHLQNGDPSTGLPESPYQIKTNQVRQIGDLWDMLKQNAGEVSQSRDMVIQMYDISVELSESIPQMQFLYQNVVDVLVYDTRNTTLEQLRYSVEQSLYGERILGSLQKVLSGGDGAQLASENFGNDVARFGQTLNYMIQGGGLSV
ncbi:MAG: type IV pili methyl-accepting chemotaxis transducer N-terminal domain-containing protein, partial [Gammaproteobacteria bacterium]|nr:type IV pili methyl-accepting chemotaxis transducer N-terminal domain-containing protein [Gammaproteobacteria bacterium]